jgi:catechol 2,3-dioxygenase-like lactoylglutathione lyase family enzyme
MDYQLEVVTVPVSDVDRSLAFYRDRLGFVLDVDYRPSADFRVVQLTPPGSACSVHLSASPLAGSVRELYLVVADVDAARRELIENGVEVGALRHKSPIDTWEGGWAPGVDPRRRDRASFAEFADPDGNTWLLQERGYPSVG